jgi:tRNA (guanine-N7-)-methyltransferase
MRKDIVSALIPTYGISNSGKTDLKQVFPGQKIVIDFGCGMGDHTRGLLETHTAAVLAIDVHTAGISDLLKFAQERPEASLRVYLGDGLDLLKSNITAESIDEIHVLFPDPWPKARHHKRRLIREDFLSACAAALVPGGLLRIVSDIPDYVANAAEVLVNDVRFSRINEQWQIPLTGYHRKAIREGRSATLLSYTKN